ncbi:MAG TPA: 5'-3' exonuclease H3TH domain-containing protein, partial [Burkholderiaceae bacterium]|nr:5'-3' exonuclease H3TH domain-containing protein [Burkholderiaceae bacterium]
PPVPVVIVTGDRDAFQLIDPEGVVRVMATARGITETKVYDHDAVIERYGIPPELIPDFYGLKGDTSDNIPGVPGIGDKTAAQLLQRFGTLEEVLAHVDDVSGAKRQQNLREHADDARVSKVLATMQRDVAGIELDPTTEAAREPDRSRLRETFREFELRDPLRRLEEALGEDAAAAADETQVAARLRAGSPADAARLGDGEAPVAVAVRAPALAEGELFAREQQWAFGVACGAEVIEGEVATPDELIAALGDRAVIAHDAKALGTVPPRLVHDTLLAAYLLDPARRAFPFAELCQERGLATALDEGPASDAVLAQELAALQRAELAERGQEQLLDDVELPLVRVLRDMEVAGVRLNIERLREIGGRVSDEIAGLERAIWDLAG